MRRFAVSTSLLVCLLVLTSAVAADIPFGPQRIVSTADSKGIDVIAGDLDGDGDLDLVASAGTNTPSGVYWYENLDGKGAYSTSRVIADDTGGLSNRSSIQLADMDGDGDLDLLTGYVYECWWYPNDGQGNFGARAVVRDESFFGSWYTEFAAADIDGDGDLDVAAIAGSTLYAANKLVWFKNNGSGSFNPATENLVGSLVNDDNGRVVPADMDGDGDIDLVATETGGTDRVVWYRNLDGAGSFSAKLTISIDSFFTLADMDVADIDGDGDLDVVSSDYSFSTDRWHENTAGDGSAWVDHPMGVSDTFSGFVRTVDMDLDGDVDVLVATRLSNQTVWLENNGNGTGWTRRIAATSVDWPLGASAADLDGDGDPDVATASLNDNKISWNENRTIHRNAVFPAQSVISTAASSARSVYAADVDGDGDVDALSASNLDNKIAWYENDGAGTPGWTARTISSSAAGAVAVFAADVDGDGDMDALSASMNDNKIAWYESNGASPPGWTARTISTSVNTPRSVFAADVDGDGDVDVLSASSADDKIAWYENNGASPPGWTARTITTSALSAFSVYAADVDGDGDLDVLSSSGLDNRIAWYENNGATPPGWTARTISSAANGPNSVVAADVDGDGDVDALSSSYDDDKIAWYENNGASPPVWTTRTITTVANGALKVAAADVDGDGDVDALSAALLDGSIVWYENNGATPPGWTARTISTGTPSAYSVCAADVDGDGDLDALSASASDNKIAWYANRGGQYGFTGADVSTGFAYDGEVVPVLALGVQLHGRPGDSVGRVATLGIKLESGGHAPLSSAQGNALFDELRIYRDDGNGTFGESTDILVATVGTLSLTGGVETVTLPAGDPNVRVAAPATFFVAPLMATNASTQAPSSFFVTHLAVTGSSVVDANAGVALTGAAMADLATAAALQARPRYVVNSTSDAVDAAPGNGVCATGGAVCTLRAAIQEANAHAGVDRIVLPAGTFTLSIAGTNENAAATGDLDITDATGRLTLVGQGPGQTIISAGGIDRVLEMQSGTSLTLEDVTITGGSFGSSGAEGGGLLAHTSTSLTIRRCAFRGNALTGVSTGGGALSVNTGAVASVESSVFHGNTATIGASAIRNSGSLTLTSSTVSGNTGADPTNVAIDNSGTLNVESCTITGNKGGMRSVGSTTTLGSTIVAANPHPTFTGDDLVSGTFTSAGYNFIGEVAAGVSFGGAGDQLGTAGAPLDPVLKPLGDYGGPTLTHQPLPSSPVVDKGRCLIVTADQRGVHRPIDITGVANASDACDVGAHELEPGGALARIEVPIRWCGLHGSPSVENPSLMGASNVNDLLRRRHEVATDNIYTPQTGIVFRSAANFSVVSYPVLEDSDCVLVSPGNYSCTHGVRGDVYIDPDAAIFDEYEELIASCRAAWQAMDPKIEGITAVQVNHFVDKNGNALSILGIGGRAKEGDAREQAEAGRVAVVDHFYRQSANPVDTIDRLLGHELGHALSLRHGDGLDNDSNTVIDDNDEAAVGLPRFDGDNIMQYRSGITLTTGQATQARSHLLSTVPDVAVQPFSDAVPDAIPIEPKNARVLEFGFDGVLDLANARVLEFKNANVLEFENDTILDLANARVLEFKNANVLEFKNARVLEFGMSYAGETPAASSTLHATTAAIPWPPSLRPKTRYFFYLDVDRDDATGAYPADKVNPSDAPNHFPGSNNFVSSPTVAEEAGVDLIAQVEIESTCAGTDCSTTSQVRIFDFNDGTGVYAQVSSTPSPKITAVDVGLYVDNGGAPVDLDAAPTGITVQPAIPNSVLFAAGWGFITPPGGGAPVPNPVRMEVVTTIGCAGNVLNDGSAADSRNCQCASCASCPDYPGCVGTVGTPQTLSGPTILTDHRTAELTFESPVLPACTVIPQLASQGQAVTVYITQLPTNLAGTVEVTRTGTVIGTSPTGSINAAGSVSVAATLPSAALGQVTLSAGITGYAPRAQCLVTVTPTLACPDADGDGTCDSVDSDDDNDGVTDAGDSAPLNRLVCRDVDLDQCDDCASAVNAPLRDGPDYDHDGACDRGDPDDDNDGVLDGVDGQPFNANACGDSDGDQCDDCVVSGTPSPGNDGPDADADGLCDFGDHDADGDGTLDWQDCAPSDVTVRAAPVEVAGFGFGTVGNKNRLSWTAPQAQGGSATLSDVLRGTRAGLPVGSGAETCLATGSSAAQVDDATSPTSGQVLWYLVRARNACGNGGYGTRSGGAARTSSACP